MNPLSTAAQVVYAATGEKIAECTCLISKGILQDFEVTTELGRIFTVTVNVETNIPQGHFFEGKDPTKSRLTNFRFESTSKVIFN